MKKVLSSIALTSLLFSSLFSVSASAAEQLGEGPLFSKEQVINQMQLEKEKQVQYHIDEYFGLNNQERQSYLQEYSSASDLGAAPFEVSLNNVNESGLEQVFEEKIDNAYIYTMDDLGYIYDKDGEVVEKLDLETPSLDSAAITEESVITPYAVSVDSTISGSNTGAFVRQTTSSGYKGIRTAFILPTASYFNVPDATTTTGYLYNGLDVLSSAYPGTGFKVEAGLQWSQALNNYAASIRPLGSGQIFSPEGYGTNIPLRYKQGTNIVSNLLYDTASSQVKYFVDGTNINGANQYIYFYYTKALSSSELAALAVKRVTAIAKEGWTGTSLGSVQVTYTSTTVTSNSGTTSNLTSSMLNAHKYNNKTYGTSDNPSTGITKTGNVDTQKIIINTTGY